MDESQSVATQTPAILVEKPSSASDGVWLQPPEKRVKLEEEATNAEMEEEATNAEMEVEATNAEMEVEATNAEMEVEATNAGMEEEATNAGMEKKEATNAGMEEEATNAEMEEKEATNAGMEEEVANAEMDAETKFIFSLFHEVYPDENGVVNWHEPRPEDKVKPGTKDKEEELKEQKPVEQSEQPKGTHKMKLRQKLPKPIPYGDLAKFKQDANDEGMKFRRNPKRMGIPKVDYDENPTSCLRLGIRY